jgi:hypothetical protein
LEKQRELETETDDPDVQIKYDWEKFLKEKLLTSFDHYFTTPRMDQAEIDAAKVNIVSINYRLTPLFTPWGKRV